MPQSVRCDYGCSYVVHPQVFEEGQDQRRIKIVERQLARALVQLAMSKSEQEPKTVAIGRHGTWTDLLLLYQPETDHDIRWDGFHDR